MDKNLEQKIRAYIKGYAKIEETETIYDEIDSYKSKHFSKKLEEPFYIFDKRRDGYYKFCVVKDGIMKGLFLILKMNTMKMNLPSLSMYIL